MSESFKSVPKITDQPLSVITREASTIQRLQGSLNPNDILESIRLAAVVVEQAKELLNQQIKRRNDLVQKLFNVAEPSDFLLTPN